MKLDPNDVAGYYDPHYINPRWRMFKNICKNIAKYPWADACSIGVLAVPFVLLFWVYGFPTQWDAHLKHGPIASKIPATITSINYCANCDAGMTNTSPLTRYTFVGTKVGRYTANILNSQPLIQSGDSVILNINDNGDVLTLIDVTANHRYCADGADCDY